MARDRLLSADNGHYRPLVAAADAPATRIVNRARTFGIECSSSMVYLERWSSSASPVPLANHLKRAGGADVRRGVFSCGNLKQSSRGVVLVQYTYGDGILTRVVARRRPEGISRYLPLHSSVQPMEHKSNQQGCRNGVWRSPCLRPSRSYRPSRLRSM